MLGYVACARNCGASLVFFHVTTLTLSLILILRLTLTLQPYPNPYRNPVVQM